MSLVLTGLVLVAAMAPARAQTPQFGLPIACSVGETCWVVNHFDHDAGPGWRDYRCGAMSYDKHEGTDIAVRDMIAMREGVPVLAAAAGQVANIRDGMQDVSVDEIGEAAIAGRACGNAVVVRHPDGWQTMYCHLRSGSVRVTPGQTVSAGTALGMVGLSGSTVFPHVHFQVMRNGKAVDPFTGGPSPLCDAGAPAETQPTTLWQPEIAPRLRDSGAQLVSYGITVQPPDERAVQRGEHRLATARSDVPQLMLWLLTYGVAAGDQLSLRLSDPGGATLAENTLVVEQAQIRRFVYIGRRKPSAGWHPGRYVGRMEIVRARDGKRSQAETEIVIE